MSYSVLQVGCGKMGGALIRQWVTVADTKFTVITPTMTYDRAPFGREVALFNDPADLGDQQFDLVIVAVKPHMVRKVMPDYVKHLAGGGMVMSMAAGTTIATLADIFGPVACVRCMPNLPTEIGKGLTGLYGNDIITDAQKDQLAAIYDPTGKIVWVDSEDQLDRFTPPAGSGPGFVFEMARLYTAATMKLGFDEEVARDMVLQTFAGSVALAQQSDLTLEELRDNVARPGGSTEAGLEALGRDGLLEDLMNQMLTSAYERTQELAKQ